jgi:hypothetical protein
MSQDFLKPFLGTSDPDVSPSREEVLEVVTAAYERNKSQSAEQLELAESYAMHFERLARLLRMDPERVLDEPELLDGYPAPEKLRQMARDLYAARVNLVPLELVLRAAGEPPK